MRDILKLVEGNSTLYAQFIDHMLQMNSICLKKYNENKGDAEEINTNTFGDTGVTKIFLIREGQISKIIYKLKRYMLCQFHKEHINVKK